MADNSRKRHIFNPGLSGTVDIEVTLDDALLDDSEMSAVGSAKLEFYRTVGTPLGSFTTEVSVTNINDGYVTFVYDSTTFDATGSAGGVYTAYIPTGKTEGSCKMRLILLTSSGDFDEGMVIQPELEAVFSL